MAKGLDGRLWILLGEPRQRLPCRPEAEAKEFVAIITSDSLFEVVDSFPELPFGREQPSVLVEDWR